jgi:hypothetical protein
VIGVALGQIGFFVGLNRVHVERIEHGLPWTNR